MSPRNSLRTSNIHRSKHQDMIDVPCKTLHTNRCDGRTCERDATPDLSFSRASEGSPLSITQGEKLLCSDKPETHHACTFWCEKCSVALSGREIVVSAGEVDISAI